VSATFFGHPRGLATLFFTEMWERFSFYGIRAVLILFLTAAVTNGGFGIDDKTAAAIYGLYTAGTYLTALPGGWIADRLIGARNAVMTGGLLITLGNFLLAIAGGPSGFYIGLLVIVLGVGLLKPNVSAIVGELYPEGGARLDSGFTVFYMGINVGAAAGPIVTGAAAVYFGPRAGFATAAIFMAFGVLQFYWTQHFLGNAGKFTVHSSGPAPARKPWPALLIACAVLAAAVLACTTGWISLEANALAQAVSVLMVAMAVLYFAYLLLGAGLTLDERKRALVLIVLFLGSVLFWTGYEQAGSSLNLFAERYTDRTIDLIRFMIPTEWFQSLNPVFIIVFSPLLAWGWVALARRNLNPSAPAKFAIGIMLVGAGFLVMAAAAKIVAGGTKVLPTWLFFTYLLHTFGEICLSPVGLSYSTKLAPKRFAGQIMGMWFLSLSLGNLLAGLVAGQFDAQNLAAMPGQYMELVYCMVGLGVLLLAISRPVKKLMGNIE
jgi:proton-dependent oligopeptide transporter, POT family